jgi:hypothetical protein
MVKASVTGVYSISSQPAPLSQRFLLLSASYIYSTAWMTNKYHTSIMPNLAL